MGTSRLYVDPIRFGLNPQEKWREKKTTNLDLSRFFKVFQAQNLREFSRQPSGFDPDSLELKRPTFDRVRPTFSFFFTFFDPPKYEHSTFSFYF